MKKFLLTLFVCDAVSFCVGFFLVAVLAGAL